MICPHCGAKLPDGLRACFRCGEPLGAAPPPAERRAGAAGRGREARRGGKPRGKAPAIIAAVLVLVLAAAGGHYMGLYELPLLPEIDLETRSGEEEEREREAPPQEEDGGEAGQPEAEDDKPPDGDSARPDAEEAQAAEAARSESEEETQAAEAVQPEAAAEAKTQAAVYSLPGVEFTVYSDGSAAVELSAYPTPNWLLERQAGTEDSPGTRMYWTLYFASDSRDLYFSGTGISAGNSVLPTLVGYPAPPGYNGYRFTTDLEGMVASVSGDSITWDFTPRDNDGFDVNVDLENLTFIGYDMENSTVEIVSRSFALENGEWVDKGEIRPLEYYREQSQ